MFSLLEIGKSSLMATRRSMDVTGHNIANSATPGYSRQEAVLEPIVLRQSKLPGMGVRVSEITRIRDRFVDSVYRNETGKLGWYSVQKDVIEHLQVVMAEPSDHSLKNALDSFWSAWNDLAIEPTSAAARAQVMETGRAVADTFRYLGTQMDALSSNVENSIKALIERVNLLTSKIASLNVEISRATARQEPVADLLDRRDLLIDELSELVGVTSVYQGDDGSVRVSVGGFSLVDGDRSYRLDVAFSDSGTEFRWFSGNDFVVIDSIGGKLGGYKAARDEIIASFRKELEQLALEFSESVNAIHRQGEPLKGESQDFFVSPGDILTTIEVNPYIVADPGHICASSAGMGPLDGSNAWAIAAAIQGDGLSVDGTFVGRWAGMIGRLGVVGEKVQSGMDVQELLVKEINNRRSAISGVSVDEEIANLIRQQHAFNAASKLISVCDEMLDTLINRLGAGR